MLQAESLLIFASAYQPANPVGLTATVTTDKLFVVDFIP